MIRLKIDTRKPGQSRPGTMHWASWSKSGARKFCISGKRASFPQKREPKRQASRRWITTMQQRKLPILPKSATGFARTPGLLFRCVPRLTWQVPLRVADFNPAVAFAGVLYD